ncbi:MAG: tyrosine-type recombinase/integrase [Candidatus Acidiferrales bacterium]
MAKRRFQKGCFVKNADGRMYSMFYVDADGGSRRVKQFIGKLGDMSERAALREHARIMEDVNRKRGSVGPGGRGQNFADAVKLWQRGIAPNLSPATVRQRTSYLRAHILPRFGKSAAQSMGVQEIQQFATDLRQTLSRKTVLNVLGTVFAIMDYAGRCGIRVPAVRFRDLELGSDTAANVAPFFTREQAARIIEAAREPYKTIFAVAWCTGMRAGELLALQVRDLDFARKTIRVEKSADDRTREIRQPKTRNSVATLPMPSALAATLRAYLERHWTANSLGLLFTNRQGTRPRKRRSVVQHGLKPLLRRLGISDQHVGLHAFRHGLATELAEASVPLPVLQKQLRHADVKTTLSVYAHAIPETQRTAMEHASIGTEVPIGTASAA